MVLKSKNNLFAGEPAVIKLDLASLNTYHYQMDQEIQGLGEQIERLLAITRKLGEEIGRAHV